MSTIPIIPTVNTFPTMVNIYIQQTIKTMTRISREPSQETREKLRQAALKQHANKTQAEKDAENKKRSTSMRAYWATIPKKADEVQSNW